jgi:hypothetical protein
MMKNPIMAKLKNWDTIMPKNNCFFSVIIPIIQIIKNLHIKKRAIIPETTPKTEVKYPYKKLGIRILRICVTNKAQANIESKIKYIKNKS